MRHTCHTRACVNPEHLVSGTHAENIVDREASGRGAKADRAGPAKLTWVQVDEIRMMYLRGIRPVVIARTFGVSDTNIHEIIRNRTWREEFRNAI